MTRTRKCDRCGKPHYAYSQSLCWECNSTRSQWRGRKEIMCKKCGKITRNKGHGLCQACYSKTYMKKYHADYERKRRKKQKECVDAIEKKRNLTPKRIAWRRAYQQKWYAKNREKQLKYQSDYRRKDMARTANYKRRRMARVASLEDTLTLDEWELILFRHEYRCAYCHERDDGIPLEREHKTPASRGGGFTKDNIVPACGRCNRRKKTMTDSEFREYIMVSSY
jgi:5-methylcytosine-specific restriction endonuclease McrA